MSTLFKKRIKMRGEKGIKMKNEYYVFFTVYYVVKLYYAMYNIRLL